MVRAMSQKIRTYSELLSFSTFEERFEYLKLDGRVGQDTFGFDRYLNQIFYRSREWKAVRDQIIMRDNGCDLGIPGYEVYGRVLIHHMNPISIEDIERNTSILMDPEYLILTSHNTHNAIHYGNSGNLLLPPIERSPNDTCPWKH